MLNPAQTPSKNLGLGNSKRTFAVECLTKICCYDSKI